MDTYTVRDAETDRTIKFEWNGKEPPTDEDMIDVFAEARKLEPAHTPQPQKEQIPGPLKSNVGAGETLAHLGTSAYGVPAAGLAGLFALPFGLDTATDVVNKVQKALVYQPQTKFGKELTETVGYPFQKLDELGGYVGGKQEKAGRPMLGAALHSGISGAPIIFAGGKAILKPSPAKAMVKIDKKMNAAIDKGINKAIRPSVYKKEMHSQVAKYRRRTREGVREVVNNKDGLNLIDESGAKVKGLPKTLDQFSQAIEQTKRRVFESYDSLAKETGQTGIKIDLSPIKKELAPVFKNKTLKDLSPDTIAYAKQRIDTLVRKTQDLSVETGLLDAYGNPLTKIEKKVTGRGYYTAVETQEAIQVLNQSLKAFYENPTPAMKGKAYVDAMIANRLRKSLDNAIEQTTGKNYQALKNKYGALRTLEKDVTKRAIVDARKNMKGLIDFSDVYTGYHIVHGVLSADPATLVAGTTAKGIARYIKWRNEPNRIVKSMFGDVETLLQERQLLQLQKAH